MRTTENSMVETTLLLALQKGSPVEIIYQSGRGITQRVIQPIKIGTDWVDAYCRLRKARRKFRLSGILSARILSEFNPMN